jgi:catalase
MAATVKDNVKTRKVAFLAADGVDQAALTTVKDALTAAGAVVEIIVPRLNYIVSESDLQIPVDHSFLTAASVLYDAVYVPGGTNSVATIEADADAIHFLNEAFKHCKAIAADKTAIQVLEATYFSKKLPADFSDLTVLKEGVVVGDDPESVGINLSWQSPSIGSGKERNPEKYLHRYYKGPLAKPAAR